MATHRSRCILLVSLLCASVIEAGKVRSALFNIFGGRKEKHQHPEGVDADQAELIDFLHANGFSEYATKDWIDKFDEDVAIDCVEDMAHIVADEDYEELGMEKEIADKLQVAARKYMLLRFLQDVPLPAGAKAGVFDDLVEPLMKAGYDEPDDLQDLEEDEAQGLGIDKAHVKTLVTHAEEFEARELFHVILTTYEDPAGGANPFAAETVWRPLTNALVKGGTRTLDDLAGLETVPDGATEEQVRLLRADPRVQRHAGKQEL